MGVSEEWGVLCNQAISACAGLEIHPTHGTAHTHKSPPYLTQLPTPVGSIGLHTVSSGFLKHLRTHFKTKGSLHADGLHAILHHPSTAISGWTGLEILSLHTHTAPPLYTV